MLTRPRVVSLFAGCGGLDLGFASANYEIKFANDIDSAAFAVYRRNSTLFHSPNEETHLGDIWKLLESKTSIPQAEVVKGGFPCQGFSLAGKRRLDDSRNQLYRAMKEVIRRVQPEVFVAENVRGLQNIAHGEVLETIEQELSELGYHVNSYLLDAADFGVPQHRERLFIIGAKHNASRLQFERTHQSIGRKSRYAPKADSLPELTFDFGQGGSKKLHPYATVRDAIGDLADVPLGSVPDHTAELKYPSWYGAVIPHVKEGQRLYNFRHDRRTVVHTWEIPGGAYGESVNDDEKSLLEALSRNRRQRRFKVEGYIDGSPMGAEDLSALLGDDPERVQSMLHTLVEKGHLRERVTGKYDFRHGTYNQYQRLAWDEPARTLVTNVGNPRNMLHPSANRPLSVRECARLMSFPDDFVFGDDISAEAKYRMLGNAVPPKLAEVIARAVRTYFD